MATKEDQALIERELFTRMPRHLAEQWLAAEQADAYRYLASASDTMMIYRAQGRLQTVEKMQALLQRHHKQ